MQNGCNLMRLMTMVAMIALGGCAASDAPPEADATTPSAEPGSIHVYLHGRAEVDLSASTH